METQINTLPFYLVCQSLDEVEKSSKSNSEKMKILLRYREKVNSLFSEQSIYPYFRLLMPEKDLARPNYNLGESSLEKIYFTFFSLTKPSSQSNELDWSQQLANNLKKRFGNDAVYSTMTIGELNERLDRLANTKLNKKKTEEEMHEFLLRGLHPLEHKWLTRIILRDLHININYNIMLNSLSTHAYARYKQCNDLKLVCEEDALGIVHETHKIIPANIMYPMVPMGPTYVYEKFSDTESRIEQINNTLGEAPFDIDLKYDGWRVLSHVIMKEDREVVSSWKQHQFKYETLSNGRRILMMSRQLKSLTDIYKYLAIDVENCIIEGISCVLDGEILGWNSLTKEFIPMINGTNENLAHYEKIHNESFEMKQQPTSWLKYIIYDIIYLEGEKGMPLIKTAIQQDKEWRAKNNLRIHDDDYGDFDATTTTTTTGKNKYSLAHYPLSVRRFILQLVIKVAANNPRIEFATSHRITSIDPEYRKTQMMFLFQQYVTNKKHEGLVIKQLDSPYMIGKKTSLWMKLKPESNNTSEMDMIVLGARWGDKGSKKHDIFTEFLMGVKDVDSTQYHPVGYVEKGLKDVELQEITRQLKENVVWEKGGSSSQLPNYLSSYQSIVQTKHLPSVIFTPSKSIVLQIGCDELIHTSRYTGGFTFRHVWVERWRSDKTFDDIMTLPEFVDRGSDLPSLFIQQPQQEKKKRNISKPKVVIDEKKDDIFKGMTFVVMGYTFKSNDDDKTYTQNELQKEIQSHGGIVVQSSNNTDVIIIAENSPNKSMQLKNYISLGTYDILDFHYILDCISAGKLLKQYGYYMGFSKQTKNRTNMDEFGLSYDTETDVKRMKNVLMTIDDQIKKAKHISPSSDEKRSLELRQKELQKLPLRQQNIDLYEDIKKLRKMNSFSSLMNKIDPDEDLDRNKMRNILLGSPDSTSSASRSSTSSASQSSSTQKRKRRKKTVSTSSDTRRTHESILNNFKSIQDRYKQYRDSNPRTGIPKG